MKRIVLMTMLALFGSAQGMKGWDGKYYLVRDSEKEEQVRIELHLNITSFFGLGIYRNDFPSTYKLKEALAYLKNQAREEGLIYIQDVKNKATGRFARDYEKNLLIGQLRANNNEPIIFEGIADLKSGLPLLCLLY